MLSEQNRQIPDWSAFRFMIVGVVNTLFGLGVIYLCMWWVGLNEVAANMVGYICGVLLSFVLNAKWSFAFPGHLPFALLRFILVIAVAYLGNLLAVVVAIDAFNMNAYVAQAVGIFPYAVLTYLGSRFFAFGRQWRSSEVC